MLLSESSQYSSAFTSWMRRVAILLLWATVVQVHGRYDPNWASLDKRPLPAWFDEAKFGIFLHFGVFSVPSFGAPSEWFWYSWRHGHSPDYVKFMKQNYRPDFTYADFAPQFTAEFYDPDKWADIIEASGARYTVLTSKHTEGFTNWPSKVSFNWNSMDVGPKRDIVGELAVAVKKKRNVHFGLYHCLNEWFNPLWLKDQANNFTTRYFAQEKSMPELYELVKRYEPEVVWSDTYTGEKGGSSWRYWEAPEFLAWLYNDSPVRDTVVTNDRWDMTLCKHGDFLTCRDQFMPDHLMARKWERCDHVQKSSWGYRRDVGLEDYKEPQEIIALLAQVVSFGGNLLLNVGPTHDGRIMPIFEERLRQIGEWLKVNGDAIYSTKPWSHQNDTLTPNIWYTSRILTNGSVEVYAITLSWPTTGMLRLGAPIATPQTVIALLGYQATFTFVQTSLSLDITLPSIPFYDMPCQWAWVFKLTNLKM